MYIGAIGSRSIEAVDPQIPLIFSLAVQFAVASGFTIKTGAAEGFDQLAATVALESGGNVLLILPREDFQSLWVNSIIKKYPGKVDVVSYNPNNPSHKAWRESVKIYHPSSGSLTPFMHRLHARNWGIIEECVSVIAAPRGIEEGGTGQGLRICRGIGKTAYNLALQEDREVLLRRMDINADGTPE